MAGWPFTRSPRKASAARPRCTNGSVPRTQPTRWRGSSTTSGSGPAASCSTSPRERASSHDCSCRSARRVLAAEPVEGMRRRFVAAVPGVPMTAADRRGAPDRAPVLGRGHRRPGVPLVRRRPGLRRVRPRAPPARTGRADLERAGPLDRLGERAVVDHGPRREEGAVARPRACEMTRRLGRGTGSGRSMPRRSGTSSRSTPEGVVDRFASVSHVAVLPPAERQRVLDEVRGVLDRRIPTRGDARSCASRTASMRTGASAA